MMMLVNSDSDRYGSRRSRCTSCGDCCCCFLLHGVQRSPLPPAFMCMIVNSLAHLHSVQTTSSLPPPHTHCTHCCLCRAMDETFGGQRAAQLRSLTGMLPKSVKDFEEAADLMAKL